MAARLTFVQLKLSVGVGDQQLRITVAVQVC
jgi:hypothetical protein